MAESRGGSNLGTVDEAADPEAGAPPSPVEHEATVDEARDGGRLDMAVAALVPGVSRSAAQRLIDQGLVTADGRKRPQGFRVALGMVLRVRVPVSAPRTGLAPQASDLDVLFEDDHVMAIAKRPGTVVHPGAGHATGTLVNQLVASGRTFSVVGGDDRPGLVHRLDKDTSGVMLLAKTDAAHASLSAQFKDRTIRKAYLALVLGARLPDKLLIRSSFGRRPGDRKQFTGRVESDREAVTEIEAVCRGGLCALVVARPRTGRTHQIRVHLSEGGHPIVGDRVYGRAYPKPGSQPATEAEALKGITRQALHAWGIRFLHPADGRVVEVVAPPPRDLRNVLDAIFGPAWQEALAGVAIAG